MSFNTEAIYSQLFSLLSTTPGIVTFSRRVKSWADIDTGMCPALMLAQTVEQADVSTNMPSKWILGCVAILYVHTSANDTSTVPVIQLNNLKDAIRDTLESNILTGTQTLSGLCHRCRVTQIDTITSGEQGEFAEAWIHIEIFTTDTY